MYARRDSKLMQNMTHLPLARPSSQEMVWESTFQSAKYQMSFQYKCLTFSHQQRLPWPPSLPSVVPPPLAFVAPQSASARQWPPALSSIPFPDSAGFQDAIPTAQMQIVTLSSLITAWPYNSLKRQFQTPRQVIFERHKLKTSSWPHIQAYQLTNWWWVEVNPHEMSVLQENWHPTLYNRNPFQNHIAQKMASCKTLLSYGPAQLDWQVSDAQKSCKISPSCSGRPAGLLCLPSWQI